MLQLYRTGGGASKQGTEALERELVQRCVANSRKQLPADAENMGSAELRGYFRARALPIVRLAAGQLAAERNLPESHFKFPTDGTLERVAHSIVQEITAARMASTTTAHMPRRAAA
jgi:hypothetical protein